MAKHRGLEAADDFAEFKNMVEETQEEPVLAAPTSDYTFATGSVPTVQDPIIEEEAPNVFSEVAEQLAEEEVDSAIESVVMQAINKTAELQKSIETPAVEIPKTIISGGNKMNNNFYVPKKAVAAAGLTKELVKKVNLAKIEDEIAAELTGKGSSKISGSINVHIDAETIKNTIIKVIRAVAGKADIPNKEIFENFIEGVVGISSQISYDMNQAPLTVGNFYKDAISKLMSKNPNMSAQIAAAEAEELTSAYVGKSVAELKNGAASMPVKLLTLVIKKSAVPRANGKDDEFGIDIICNPFTADSIKSVIAEGEYLHIGINLSKIFKYVQGHFDVKDLEDSKVISATIINNSANVSSVVYKIEKK